MNELELLKKLIREFEGCKLKAYYCPAGVLTIGWGATGAGIYPNTVWTQEQADARLDRDAKRFLSATKAMFPDAGGGLLAALADFAYNLGAGNLRSSTLRKRVLSGDLVGAKKQFRRWVYGRNRHGGMTKLNGLIRRREAEVSLF